MMGFATDVRHILRSLIRRPAFSIAAVLTLALGMAGVISIIAIADMAVLRPLPSMRIARRSRRRPPRPDLRRPRRSQDLPRRNPRVT